MIAALAVAMAVLLTTLPSRSRARLRRTLPVLPVVRARLTPPNRAQITRASVMLMGIAIAVWVGGVPGLLAGAVATGIALAFISRMEPRSRRRQRQALARQMPQTAHLLAACLSSGATIESAVAAVASASPEPMRTELDFVRRGLLVGSRDPWARLRPSPLARALERSRDSGAPLSEVLIWIAVESRRESRAAAETAARSAGVKAVAPLAACFLPSFLLIAVVPVVADLAQSMWR